MASVAGMSILNSAPPTRTRAILPLLVADVVTLMHPCFNSLHGCTNKVNIPFTHMEAISMSLPSRAFKDFSRLKNKVAATKGVFAVCEPLPPDRPLWFPRSFKYSRCAFQYPDKSFLSKSSLKNGRWYLEKGRGSEYGGSEMKKRKETSGKKYKKYEKSPIGGRNGPSWELAANNYFSKGRDDAMNENVEVLVGDSEIEKKATMKTSYNKLEDNARAYLSVDNRGGVDDSMRKKVGSGGDRGGLKGRWKRNQSFGGEEDGANDHHFLQGWSKTAMKGKDWMPQEAEDDEDSDEENEAEEGKKKLTSNSRWSGIRDRYSRVLDARDEFDKPDVVQWNRQENWGQKVWKEAHESTLPKIVGEVVYGVGPVLAALTTGRREFYVLYVQEGLELGGSNRKKDKKSVKMVMRIAERIGLSMKEASKHDLNMLADNKPHQGFILDASPLDMVSIRQLDASSCKEEQGPLWVALDEVTDPHNFGAVIRSAYFFGAAGVVVCAKNSAPLSGVVSKASAGALECMELRSCRNMMQFLSMSAENGWRVLGGSVSSRALPLNEVPSAGGPTILVLGSEGKGLRPLVEQSCTQLVRISANFSVGNGEDEYQDESERSSGVEFQSFLAVESLNVSVAAGILLHHLSGNAKPRSILESVQAIE
ncbi:uncharacterized protein LOC116258192 [Nymphaea colorata]|nr:uncharacterized protein LOC116258192 [Nymphaea colorata]